MIRFVKFEVIYKLKLDKVQKIIDSDVLKYNANLIPLDTGTLMKSGNVYTQIGSGKVIYKTPYAKRQYYEHKSFEFRGRLWFERMKSGYNEIILRDAQEALKS